MLAAHLFAAGDYVRLDRLLDPDWMQIRARYDGTYSGFLSDIDLAWKSTLLAEQPQIAQQLRYALYQSTIRSLVINVPALLYPFLVEYGLWTFPQAVSFAAEIPELDTRVRALLGVSQVHGLLVAHKRFAVTEAFKTKTEWSGPETRLGFLIRTIAICLHAEDRFELLSTARSLISPMVRQEALSDIAILLPREVSQAVFEEALALARSFESAEHRAQALVNLAPLSPREILAETLSEISLIDSSSRCRLLSDIACCLPSVLHKRAIDIAEQARSIDPDGFVEVLVSLAIQRPTKKYTLLPATYSVPFKRHAIRKTLRQYELSIAQKTAAGIEDIGRRADAFIELARAIPEFQDEAFALTLQHDPDLSTYWTASKILTIRLKPALQDRVLQIARNMEYDYLKRNKIEALAWQLDPKGLDKALEITSQMEDPQLQRETIANIVYFLPEPKRRYWVEETYKRALAVTDEAFRQEAVMALQNCRDDATHQESESVKATTDTVETWQFVDQLESGLTGLRKSRLTQGRIEITTPQRIDWHLITRLSDRLPKLDDRTAISIAQRVIDYERSRSTSHPKFSFLLGKLAPRLPQALLVDVFQCAVRRISQLGLDDLKVEDERYEFTYLCLIADLAPCVRPDALLSRLTWEIRSIENSTLRKCVFLALAPLLIRCDAPELVQTAELEPEYSKEGQPAHDYREYKSFVDSAFGMTTELPREWVLLSLLPHLPQDDVVHVLPDCVKAASRWSWNGFLTQAAVLRISDSVPLVSCEEIVYILDTNPNVSQDSSFARLPSVARDVRPSVLDTLAQRLLPLPTSIQRQQWELLLPALANRDRARFLHQLAAFAQVMQSLGGDAAVEQSIGVIENLAFWPPLELPLLSTDKSKLSGSVNG
jgi:hypothetical protein